MKQYSDEVEEIAGGELQEFKERPTPVFIYFIYVVVFAIGLIWYILFWNGSDGLLDRGYWKALEEAAHTRYPYESPDSP